MTTIIDSLEETYLTIIESGVSMPNFRNSKSVFCFSDYAGDRRTDKNYVYSYLFFDYEKSIEFITKVNDLRRTEPLWENKSYIEYKKIPKDNIRTRMLTKFLKIVDSLNGILIVVYVDKTIESFFENNKEDLSNLIEENKLGSWKPHIIEKLFQILLFQAFFASKLINKNHEYFWYSDRDAINNEGKSKFEHVGTLLGSFFKYFNIKLSKISFATNFEDECPDNHFGDILSIPDLIAGASLEQFEQILGEDVVKNTTNDIMEWFSKPSSSLSKIHLSIRKDKDKIITSIVDWKLKE